MIGQGFSQINGLTQREIAIGRANRMARKRTHFFLAPHFFSWKLRLNSENVQRVATQNRVVLLDLDLFPLLLARNLENHVLP